MTAAALLAMLAACSKTNTSLGAAGPDDMTMGNPNAKVLFAEYASVGCPHCAAFNNDEFPAFKKKYIDTGRVHYVFHEFLVGQGAELAMAEAGFLLARCAGKDKYFAVNDEIFHQQQAIEADPRNGLLRIAQSAGMTEPQFNACINDKAGLKGLEDRVNKALKDGVNSTPTFIINGKMLVGDEPLSELDKAITAAEKN